MTISTKSGLSNDARGAFVGRVVELPIRRPQPPQQLAQFAPVRLQAGAAALGVEIILIPERDAPARASPASRRPRCSAWNSRWPTTRPRTRSGHKAATTQAARPPQSKPTSTARGRRSASISSSRSLPDRGLLARAHRLGREESRRAIAAQIRHDRAVSARYERGTTSSKAARVVGKPVHQQHREARRRPALLIGDLERARADALDRRLSRVARTPDRKPEASRPRAGS